MRLVVRRKALQRILRWSQRACLVVAVGTLAYCEYVLMDVWIFQSRERHRLDHLLDNRQVKTGAVAPTPAEGLFGRIEIPRLGLSVIVVEGVEPVRHPPRSGWLDELGRLKGGRSKVQASR